MSECEKASLVGHKMLWRHNRSIRGKALTAFMAAILLEFVKGRLSTAFLDPSDVATARASCQMTPVELRRERIVPQLHTALLITGIVEPVKDLFPHRDRSEIGTWNLQRYVRLKSVRFCRYFET